MSEEEDDTVNELEFKGIIGFDGTTIRGLIVHPDGKHLVYPLGNKVTIQDWATKSQVFLSGHTNTISAIDVSRSGAYIASGQITHIGFKARVIIWDFHTRTILSEHELHKVRVEAVTFSKDDAYLYSLGGRDCGSLVVWDIQHSNVVCGAAASRGIQGEATTLLTMNQRGPCFMTGGDNHLAVWTVDSHSRKVNCMDVNTGKIKRNILCMDVNERDEVCYCGTATGDVLKVRLNYHHDPEITVPSKHPAIVGCFARIINKKLPPGKVHLYSLGVKTIKRLFSGPLLIGAGDGTLELVEETKGRLPNDIDFGVKYPSMPTLRMLKATNLFYAVTSLQFINNEKTILAGTVNCEVFAVDFETFNTELIVTCHNSTIYDLAFPNNYSDVFATAGKNNVRVWSMDTMQELLRINVPNFSASSVLFSHDGKSILTAWNDGIIRSFTPLTGRLIYAILNAHNKGVSALSTTSDGKILVSGGCEGQVRMWAVSPYRQELICSLNEHKAPVSAIDINKAGIEAVSASTDGTCIIWDLVRQCRRQILFGSTLFMCARYYPTDVQILTSGSDRKLSYWEVLDGSLVREIEGSRSGAINTLDISLDGEIFATGGNDQMVKLWKYQEGEVTHFGLGHAAIITGARFSPDQKYIVTADGAGCIFVWKNPHVNKKGETAKVESGRKEDLGELKVDADLKDKEADEVIQDLPTARSETSSGRTCRCTCPTEDKSLEHGAIRMVVGCGDAASRRSTGSRRNECPKGSSKTSSTTSSSRSGKVTPGSIRCTRRT